MTDKTYTKSNGEQILMEQVNGTWHVSCYTKFGDTRWVIPFKSEEAAKVEFERWKD